MLRRRHFSTRISSTTQHATECSVCTIGVELEFWNWELDSSCQPAIIIFILGIAVSVASRHNTRDNGVDLRGDFMLLRICYLLFLFVHAWLPNTDRSLACSRLDLTGGRRENRRISPTADMDGLEGGESGGLVLGKKRLFTRRERFAETFQGRENLGRLERVLSVRDFAELVIAFKSSETFSKLTT